MTLFPCLNQRMKTLQKQREIYGTETRRKPDLMFKLQLKRDGNMSRHVSVA